MNLELAGLFLLMGLVLAWISLRTHSRKAYPPMNIYADRNPKLYRFMRVVDGVFLLACFSAFLYYLLGFALE